MGCERFSDRLIRNINVIYIGKHGTDTGNIVVCLPSFVDHNINARFGIIQLTQLCCMLAYSAVTFA